MFAYGTTCIRAKGRHWLKIYYCQEMLMSCLEIGDDVITTRLYLPTDKIAELLHQAYLAQIDDSNAIGHKTWTTDTYVTNITA
jgi:hypothetical protein